MTTIISLLRVAIFCVLATQSSFIFAEPTLHIFYHMEKGTKDNFFVAGELENRGRENIYQGYIVITPMTKSCYPMSPQLWHFGGIKSRKKHAFKIPIRGNYSNYNLDVVHAVNSFGSKVGVIDKAISIVEIENIKNIERCKKERVYHK